MSQQGSYKKITVSSHADSSSNHEGDEEVIYVGASASSHDHAKTPSPSSERVPQEAPESPESAELPDESKPQTSDDEYYDQTLDDLNNIDVPFQKTQRIVLIVMGLLVIAFCVYWFGLR